MYIYLYMWNKSTVYWTHHFITNILVSYHTTRALQSSDKMTELHPSLLLSTLLAVLQILTRLFQPLRKYKRYIYIYIYIY